MLRTKSMQPALRSRSNGAMCIGYSDKDSCLFHNFVLHDGISMLFGKNYHPDKTFVYKYHLGSWKVQVTVHKRNFVHRMQSHTLVPGP